MRDYLSIQSEVNAFLQAAEKVKSMVCLKSADSHLQEFCLHYEKPLG